MVPQGYIALKKGKASKEALVDFVRALCLEAIQEDALRKGLLAPQEVDSALIDMTYDMYEHALKKRKK